MKTPPPFARIRDFSSDSATSYVGKLLPFAETYCQWNLNFVYNQFAYDNQKDRILDKNDNRDPNNESSKD